jgi:hypothetical protein
LELKIIQRQKETGKTKIKMEKKRKIKKRKRQVETGRMRERIKK